MSTNVPKVQLLKHPNKRSPNWYLRYWSSSTNGKQKDVWVSTRTPNKSIAEQKRRALERQLEDGGGPDARLGWDEFVEEFLVKHASRKEPNTYSLYQHCLKMFGTTARPRELRRVNVGMLEDYANSRCEVGVEPTTVNKELRHIKAALRWAKRRGFIRDVPEFTGVFIRVEQRRPVTIPEAHFLKMVHALAQPDIQLEYCSRHWWKVFLYLAYYLGLRRGELLGLRWDSVSLAQKQILVRAGTSKSRKDRPIPLPPELCDLLQLWMTEQAASGPIDEVLPWKLDSYRSLYHDWHAIQDAAGFDRPDHYVPKDCRSSCATELIRAAFPRLSFRTFLVTEVSSRRQSTTSMLRRR